MDDFIQVPDETIDINDSSLSSNKEVDSVFESVLDEVINTESQDKDNSQQDNEEQNTDADISSEEQSNESSTEESPEENQVDPTIPDEDIDYKAFYKEMMSPIKANGKTFSLQNAQEARQLIQMGANYTKKMQDIAPQRKILEYLKQNNINSEQDVLYLVDLANGNQSAIQKWVQDKHIDLNNIASPEYDEEGNPKPVVYTPSSSMPDDKYMAANSIMADIQQTPEGYDFIQEVCSWDSASRATLYNNPTLLYELQTQKQNGIFNKIADEVERRKTVGSLPSSMDFLTAYARVGTELNKQGLLYTNNKPANNNSTTNANVITKPYIQHRNTNMQNNNMNNNNAAQVKSAGLTRMSNASTTKSNSKSELIKNLYKNNINGGLSGDEFIEQFNRLFKISD